MHWKLKAAAQTAIAFLPPSASWAAYYWLQRRFGGLRSLSPVDRLVAGIQTWHRIGHLGHNPVGRVFFELGTGTATMVPLAYWLMGAARTITFDLNTYLKAEIVRENLEYIERNQRDIVGLFGELLVPQRMEALLRFQADDTFSLARFLDLCSIQYVSPGDAARTGLPSRSVDFHTSFTVFEHIPPRVLAEILQEGNRVVRPDGLFVHMIDYSDHFSHDDSNISAVNFLQYSDAEWARYAGNRYMYMNRLRHDDMLALFDAAGHRILAVSTSVDPRVVSLLEGNQFTLSEPFSAKPLDVLSIRSAWVVSQAVSGR